MIWLARLLGFQNDTFNDHTGQPSFSRKALAALIVAMIMLIFLCMALVAWTGSGEALNKLLSTSLAALGSVISIGWAAVQGAKAHAQSATAKTTTVTDQSTSPPITPTPQPATAKAATVAEKEASNP